MESSTPADYLNDIDSSNIINGKPIYYWIGQQNKIVPTNAGYVTLINYRGIAVQNVNLTGSMQGAVLINTRNPSTVNSEINNINQNAAIQIQDSTNIVVLNNSLSRSSRAVSINASQSSLILNNNITASSIGGIQINPKTNSTTIYGNYLAGKYR